MAASALPQHDVYGVVAFHVHVPQASEASCVPAFATYGVKRPLVAHDLKLDSFDVK